MLKARTQRIAGAPRWTPSPAMIVSLLALFVALGGSAYAAFSLPPNSVGTIQLKNGAVSGAKLKNDAVTSSKIKNGTLLAKDFKLGQLPSDDAFIAASGTGSITRDVAPGLYLVTGEANYVSHIATDFIAQCTLTSPSPVSYHVDRSTLHAGDSLTIPIHGSVRFAEAGTITVTCPTVAGIDAAPYIALIKVASLSEPSG